MENYRHIRPEDHEVLGVDRVIDGLMENYNESLCQPLIPHGLQVLSVYNYP
jgi:hypothetical protein